MVEHPTGTVTFLFTDIEGSTRRWEEDPDAMAGAVARHDEIMRAVVAGHGGRLIKQTGDGVFAVFEQPAAGLNAALAAQRSLGAEQWDTPGALSVRMGLHTGSAVARENDYFGPEVNRAARLMGVAHGGQILVSHVTGDMASAALPPDITLDDLGMHRLRDLSEPLRVYQLSATGLRSEFPSLRSVDGYPNNLPAAVSSFVGRDQDIAAVLDQLASTRLLSLTGAGGSGKTRLALQASAESLVAFDDGAWFVDLAGLTEPALVPREIAATLSLTELPGRAWIDVLRSYVSDRTLLLVIDNCEHMLDAIATTVSELLAASPHLRVLATSREPLNVPGEVSWRVPTMQLPADGADQGLDDLLEVESVRLFVERALAARPKLELSDSDAPAIAEICRRLDGLPLALELAAARVRALSVQQIAEHLGDRFTLLSGGSRTALPRHRTLEGAVAWSYELLEDDERELFESLCVFAGGFNLEAALAVAGTVALGGVPSLVEKSLVVADQLHDEVRYRMLETVAAFGHQRLGERFAAGRDAHLAWAAGLAGRAVTNLETPDQLEWLERIEAELDNLRAAMQWALDGGNPLSGLVIAGSLYRYWYMRGVREGRRWIELFLAANPDAPPPIRGRALFAAGSLIQSMGQYEKASELLDESRHILSDLGERRGAAYALHYLIRARWGSTVADELRTMVDTALAEFRQVEDPVGLALTLLFDALWHINFGSVEDAEAVTPKLSALVNEIGAPQLVAHGAEIPAVVAWLKGDFATSAARLHDAMDVYLQLGNPQCAAHCLENTAGWAARSARAEDAAVMLGASAALRLEVGIPTPDFEKVLHDVITDETRAALGAVAFADAFARGETMSMDRALEYGRATTAAGSVS